MTRRRPRFLDEDLPHDAPRNGTATRKAARLALAPGESPSSADRTIWMVGESSMISTRIMVILRSTG